MTDYWYSRALDQIASDPLIKAPASSTAAKPAEDFQKILEQRSSGDAQKPETKTAAKTEARSDAQTETQSAGSKAETTAQTEEKPLVTEDPKELENQMALAAMAVMQNPVVMAEEPLPQETEAAVLAPVAADDGAEEVQAELLPAGQEEIQAPAEEESAEPETQVQTRVQPKETAEAEEKPEQAGVTVRETGRDQSAAGQKAERAAVEEVPRDAAGEEEQQTPVEADVETPVFEDVRDIPVKVGEAPAEEPEPEVPVEEQLGSKLAQAVKAGETHVEMQLSPENLGRVTVEMTFAENGSLHVTLHAENGRTMSLLEKGLDNLHLMLARNTRQDVQVEVQKQEESQQQSSYDGHGGHARHQGQNREHRDDRRSGDDFLQQLRLGLIPGDSQ